MRKRKASLKNSWDDDIQEKNNITYFSEDGMALTCGICGKSIKSRRPFNNERWNEHLKSKAHSEKYMSLTNQSKINELFLPISSKMVTKKLPFAPKVCPGIHPGHEYLNLMKAYGKYDDLNVHFMCELDGEEVKAIHKQCTGKYRNKLCKTQKINSCVKCAEVHRKKIFYKRLSSMANVKNVLDILALPEITDRQITDLERFCFDISASNKKAALIIRVKNYIKYAK